MPVETELKLDLNADCADALEASGLDRHASVTELLVSRYFDTPDFSLRSAGVSLRIRSSGQKRIQTVKLRNGTPAGLFERAEWEMPVTGERPEPDDRTPLAELLGHRTADLAEVYTVRLQRRSWRFPQAASEIELSIDRGEVCCGDRHMRFCETELELIRGNPAALFAMARGIDTIAPVRLGVLTKSERGYRLLGPLPVSSKAGPVVLEAGDDLPQVFVTIAQHCMAQYRLNESILLERRAPGAVHQARVALRRLRSSMTLFRTLLPEPERQAFQARLRRLAAVLGKARDLDVLCTMVEPGPLAERLSAAREAAYVRSGEVLASAEPRRLMLDLSAWLACGNWRHDPATRDIRAMPPREFAAGTLGRLRRKLRRKGRRLASLSVDARHELRKDAKKLRYAIEFLSSLYQQPEERLQRRQFAKALGVLQDELGAMNDSETAHRCVAQLGLGETESAAAFLAKWDMPDLLDGAVAARHRLLDLEPFWQ